MGLIKRRGGGGFLKNVFTGIVEGIADGGIGGGNILRNVAENIVGGGSGASAPTYGNMPAGTARTVPGTLNFNEELEQNIALEMQGQGDFANALDFDINEDQTWMPNAVTPDQPMHPAQAAGYARPPSPNAEMPPPHIPFRRDPVAAALGNEQWGPSQFGTSGAPIQYNAPIGPPNNPNLVGGYTGSTYTASGGSCSCRPKRTCEEKCAYDAQMKEQCKGCKTYFRRKKQYIYPKRRRYYKRRSYRRRSKSTRRGTRGFYTDEDKCFALAAKLRSGSRLSKPNYRYYKRCVNAGRIGAVF